MNVKDGVNLNVTQWFRGLCPMLVGLATEAVDNEDAYAFVKADGKRNAKASSKN